jgi:hypothetical protein
MKGVSKVKIFDGKSKKTRGDELRDGKLYKFEGEGGSYKNWPLKKTKNRGHGFRTGSKWIPKIGRPACSSPNLAL